jgi:diguanylate cyclase (GGDEF)-like protein
MPVAYAQTLSVDMIMAEIEALLDWRGHIFRHCFFPGSQPKPPEPQAPSALLMWCRRGGEGGSLDRNIVDHISVVYDELCAAARTMLGYCAAGATPTIEIYDAFENQFEAYLLQVRRLHQDVSDGGLAVDSVTGLRTASGMRADLKREQDRFDRKGTSFSLASIEIDNLPELDRRAQEAVYAGVAQVIARTVRSFDDAYFLGKGEYLITLKHIEFSDACAVMDRLRADIESAAIFLPGGEKMKVTASFGVAEAMQREPSDLAFQHAKSATQEAKAAGGNRVTEFRETSALLRYAKDVKGGK